MSKIKLLIPIVLLLSILLFHITAIRIYSEKALEMLNIKGVKTYVYVFSSMEIKMLRISTNINEKNLLYKSGKFFVYK